MALVGRSGDGWQVLHVLRKDGELVVGKIDVATRAEQFVEILRGSVE